MITEELFCGASAALHYDTLATLRLEIFREYPYLYAGRREDERRYVRRYGAVDDACLLVAADNGALVGAVSGVPLANEDESLCRAVAASGRDVAAHYSVGELLLLPPYRGAQLGSRLITRLEEHVRSLRRYCGLVCATVVRPDDHPLRPAGYLPIRRFLDRHGFHPLAGATARFVWLETDGVRRDHPMQLWIKELG